MKSVLFVCMANKCRSTLLEGVLRSLAKKHQVEIHAESCGVGYVNIGGSADSRSIEVAKTLGIALDMKSQPFQDYFFTVYDYIFAVDDRVLEQLKARARPEEKAKVYLASAFTKKGGSIEDPYASPNGFEKMKDQVLDCCQGILQELTK